MLREFLLRNEQANRSDAALTRRTQASDASLQVQVEASLAHWRLLPGARPMLTVDWAANQVRCRLPTGPGPTGPGTMTDRQARTAGRGSERWVVLTHLQKKFLRCIAVKQQYKYVSQRAGILQIPKKVRKFTDLVHLSFSDHSLECLCIYTATTISGDVSSRTDDKTFE